MANSEFLKSLVGRDLNINGSSSNKKNKNNKKKGPDAVSGELYDVKEDYLVVLSDDGAQYIRLNHIKTISENFFHNNDNKNQDNDSEYDFEIYEADTFNELLRKSRYKYCTVSSGGPNKVQGIIESVDDDFVNIVSENEYVQIPLYHVRMIDFSVQQNNNDKK
ncbi:hypothetical protein [Bacillus andreraoultii]|uniref:hypothetical protein n=1 Tax=Bacillus andreraoultii TaxID=1499685 RepID=UPI000B26F718|nr:hypothetical protein [Bacillus andreraoultii]